MKRFPKSLTVCTALGVLTCAMLGVWQLKRLEWKEGILASVSKSDPTAFEPIETVIRTYKTTDAYNLKSVRLKGRFRHELEMKVIPRTLKGRSGAHLLTPFELSSGRSVFVNRGWIPGGVNQTVSIQRSQGEAELFGFIRQPGPASIFTSQNEPDKGLWFDVNLKDMTKFLSETDQKLAQGMLPFYVMLRPDGNVQSYPRGINFLSTLPNNHLQYALTWFFLAFGLLLGYIAYIRALLKPERP